LRNPLNIPDVPAADVLVEGGGLGEHGIHTRHVGRTPKNWGELGVSLVLDGGFGLVRNVQV
jgi:hypothetical protein